MARFGTAPKRPSCCREQACRGPVLPALLTTNGMLIGISTPYRRMGLLHTKHRDHYGVSDDDVLVVQGSSKAFNPSLADAAIAAQRALIPLQR